jgi:hypothetical protein
MALAETPQIGTSQAGLTPLEDLAVGIPTAIPTPRMRYYPERKRVKLTSKRYAGIGGAYIVWHWDFLKIEWRRALRDYLTAISTDDIFIETQTNEDADDDGLDDWIQCEVIATWPEGDEDKDAGRRMSFDIEFEVVEELTPLA